jgi:hypothetical protein
MCLSEQNPFNSEYPVYKKNGGNVVMCATEEDPPTKPWFLWYGVTVFITYILIIPN